MIKKYIFSIILALCLVVMLFPGIPVAAADHVHSCLCGNYNCHETGTGHEKIPNGTTWVGVNKKYITNAGGYLGQTGKTNYYYLTEDIVAINDEATEIISIRGSVVLCLNGHNIQFNNTGGGHDTGLIEIDESNAGLTICDCTSTSHQIDVNIGENKYNYTYYGGALINFRISASGTGSKVNLYRCTIRGLFEYRMSSAANISSGVINMYDGASFLGNSGSAYSGALKIKDCTFNMYGGVIAGNYKRGSNSSCTGGGVEVENNATFNMYGGFIQDNHADNGGGVFVDAESTFNMYGGTIQNNSTNGDGWQNHGGGVLIEGGTFNMEGGTITSNRTGTGNGGGIAMRGSGGVATLSGENHEIVISNNISFGTGGGIFVNSGNTFTIGNGVSIIGNKAYQCPTEGHQTPGRGGGIFSTGTLKINGGTISNNNSQEYGGGLAAGGRVDITNGTIRNNESPVGGGGVFLAGTLNMSGGSISDNVIDRENSTGTGAGVYVESGSFNFNGGSITGNKTKGMGAGLYVKSGVVTMAEDASISGNPGERGYYPNGGGVYMAGGTFDFNGGNISENIYGYKGGGAYLAGGIFNLNSGSISANGSTDGAGVYLNGGTLNLKSGGSIGKNSCTNGSGGGLFCENGTANITGGRITGNSASRGGGVFVWKDKTTFNVSGNTSISDNKAKGKTSNVDLTQNDKITITGALTENANMGITANAGTLFTSGWSTHMSGSDPVQFFTSDLDDCYVVLSGGEVEMRSGYQIEFELDGGQFVSGYTPVYSYDGNQDVLLPEAGDLTRPGYTFDGWHEKEDLSGQACTVIAAGSTGPKTYYAKWTANTYTVNFDVNGGTINGSYVTKYTYGAGAVLPDSSQITRSGYTFGGWYDNENLEGNPVAEISDTDTGDKTYYAKWTTSKYSVKLHLNDGKLADGVNDITEYAYGAGAVLPDSSQITRSGYTFGGWFDNENLEGDPVAEISVTDTGDKTYYAKWTANKYSVKLHLNDGKLADGVNDITEYIYGAGAVLPDSSQITRSGYTFGGWYDNEKPEGDPVAEISVTDTGDKTYYAKWTANKYSVKLHLNDGKLADGVNDITGYTYGAGAVLPDSSQITRSGYTFGGWYDNEKLEGSTVTEITKTDMDNKEYWAKWTRASGATGDGTYSIILDDTTNGNVKSSQRGSSSGITVILTVTADSHYQLASLTVTDSKGSNIILTDEGNGKFTFKMPASKVTVKAVFAPIPLPFKDVPEDAWYYDAVWYAYTGGMMKGISSDLFEPDTTTTRAMIVTILWRQAGGPVVNYAMDYTDVPEGEWYSEAIRWATSEGVVTGYGNKLFGTNDPITREQFAAVLWRFAQKQGYDVSAGENTNILSYTDVEDVSEYAVPAMQWTVGTGIINGTTGSTLASQGQATRAQSAMMLQRFCEEYADTE